MRQNRDYLVCQESRNASIDLTNSTEASAEIDMYKSAKVQITIPEKGFYQLTAAVARIVITLIMRMRLLYIKELVRQYISMRQEHLLLICQREFQKAAGKIKLPLL